ncbi:MAG: biotin/lipoyl-binding protein, partial [Aestuariivirga sp.]
MSSPALKKTANEIPVSAPAPIQAPAQGSTQPTAPKKSLPIRRIVLITAAVIALGVVADYGYGYITLGRFQISTDDAYVKADTSVISAKVAGLVTETPVLNNTPVKAGDVVLRLDGTDYELAMAAAKAKLATQQAALGVFAKQKIAQAAQIDATEAQVQSAKAVALNAAQTQQRASQMVKTNVGTQQALDDANRARDTAEAGVTAAESNVAAAQA